MEKPTPITKRTERQVAFLTNIGKDCVVCVECLHNIRTVFQYKCNHPSNTRNVTVPDYVEGNHSTVTQRKSCLDCNDNGACVLYEPLIDATNPRKRWFR